MVSDNMKHRCLQELGESDFEIVEGQPDIRGWDVKNGNGETIGEVDELILDAQQRKVRYMVVDLDGDGLGLDKDRTVLIPIGLAQLHEKEDDVRVPDVSASQLGKLPNYDRDHLDDAEERTISSILGRTDVSSAGTAAGFYDHEHFNDMNLYGRRLLPASTSGMRFQQKSGYQEGSLGRFEGAAHEPSAMGRVDTDSAEMEAARLQSVRNDSSDSTRDDSGNSRARDLDDRFSDRDTEGRSRDDTSSRDSNLL